MTKRWVFDDFFNCVEGDDGNEKSSEDFDKGKKRLYGI